MKDKTEKNQLKKHVKKNQSQIMLIFDTYDPCHETRITK
jgi:hypothetical protein